MPFFSAVDYRRYAAECVRLAQQVADPDDKARPLDMAETFRELADKKIRMISQGASEINLTFVIEEDEVRE